MNKWHKKVNTFSPASPEKVPIHILQCHIEVYIDKHNVITEGAEPSPAIPERIGRALK